jgi:branched-subunit amino acid aminotransferase/4-amino-4-deoxychorismate lyase
MDKISPHDAEEDAHNADIRIWVDGALKHRDQAVVPVDDSGSVLGDGVWEGLRLHNGRGTFLTGDIGAQTPVGSIDGRTIGTGDIGPVTTRLSALYKAVVTP